MTKASVVIPACKRCESVKRVFASLKHHPFPHFGYEARSLYVSKRRRESGPK